MGLIETGHFFGSAMESIMERANKNKIKILKATIKIYESAKEKLEESLLAIEATEHAEKKEAEKKTGVSGVTAGPAFCVVRENQRNQDMLELQWVVQHLNAARAEEEQLQMHDG